MSAFFGKRFFWRRFFGVTYWGPRDAESAERRRQGGARRWRQIVLRARDAQSRERDRRLRLILIAIGLDDE